MLIKFLWTIFSIGRFYQPPGLMRKRRALHGDENPLPFESRLEPKGPTDDRTPPHQSCLIRRRRPFRAGGRQRLRARALRRGAAYGDPMNHAYPVATHKGQSPLDVEA